MSMEGTVIGQYRVLRKLGEGGMGAVYLAEHSLLGRRAAVKVLQPELSQKQDIVNRFFNEARAATSIADPGIVQIFDFGYHTDGSAYIVMEFLEGEPLDGRVKRLGRLAPVDALRILRQVASSLQSAHARGIVHRDLKPENIFLVADREVAYGERPKLLDFGIAKLTHDTDSKVKTATAAIMGTPMYMSPEQCRGAGYVDHRSDLYSLGCVLYHLLVGRPPFDGEGVGDIIACHLRSPAPPPSAAVPGIPPEVDALTLRLMAKAPDERFGTAAELAEAIGIMIGTSMPPAVPGMMMPSGGYVASGQHPTTLSGSAGHLHVGAASTAGAIAPRGRRGLIAGVIAGVSIATAAVVVVIATSGGSGKTAAAGPGSSGGGSSAVETAPAAGATSAEPMVKVVEPRVRPVDPPMPVEPPRPIPVVDSPPASTGPGASAGSGSGAGSSAAVDTAASTRGTRGTRRGTREKPAASGTSTTSTTSTTATQPPATVATPPPVKPPPPARVPCDDDGDGIPDRRC